MQSTQSSELSTPYEFYGDMRPYEHQVKIIKFMLANKRGYLFADMGTGKTSSSLWFTDMLADAGKIRKVLIVGPLSTVRSVWVNEIQKVCPYRKYQVVHGSRSERLKALKSPALYYITNTDAVRTYHDEFVKAGFDILIIDEITDFANAQSKRSKRMQSLASHIPSVFGLSGNPLAKGLIASYGLAKIVRPEGLPIKYFTRYRDLILSQINLYEYVPRPGATRLVNKVLQPAIRFSLEECVDIPPIVFEERFVELPAPTMKLFKEMVKDQIAEYKDGLITAQTAGVKAIRLVQILTGHTKNEEGQIIDTDCGPKFNELINLYHESGNKLVVFCQGVPTVHRVQAFFDSKGIPCRHIYGEVPPNQRDAIINEFQNTEEGVIAAQVRTMSHGVTLTKSYTMVFFGLIAGNETYRQAIRRIRRIGQEHRQRVVKLISTKFEKTGFAKLDDTEFTAQAVLDMYNEGEEAFI